MKITINGGYEIAKEQISQNLLTVKENTMKRYNVISKFYSFLICLALIFSFLPSVRANNEELYNILQIMYFFLLFLLIKLLFNKIRLSVSIKKHTKMTIDDYVKYLKDCDDNSLKRFIITEIDVEMWRLYNVLTDLANFDVTNYEFVTVTGKYMKIIRKFREKKATSHYDIVLFSKDDAIEISFVVVECRESEDDEIVWDNCGITVYTNASSELMQECIHR